MTTLFKQLEALSEPKSKALKKFRRVYASREHYNRIAVAESWDHMLNLDPSIIQCEPIFRRCLSDTDLGLIITDESHGNAVSDDKVGSAERSPQEWTEKEIEFMQESEVIELEKILQLFLDLCSPWLSHQQCQVLIDFLIFQYELATRFSEMLLLALLPIHYSAYYEQVAGIVKLPEGSELCYFVPAKKADNKRPSDGPTTFGVSRELIIAGTVKSFSNYKRISESVERITLVHSRGGSYAPLYTVLSLAFIEQNGKKLGDSEVRLLVNNAMTALKYPQHSYYYSAQLCILSLLFATIPVAIQVQRSVVVALLNPLLRTTMAASSITLDMRIKLKDALLVILGMLQQQKERIEVFPPDCTRLLLAVFQQFPSLANIFRGMGASGESLDFSRLCKVITTSVVRAAKHASGKPSNSNKLTEEDSLDLIRCTVDFFAGLDLSICYVRIMLTTLIDQLMTLAMSCKNGESLFEWDSSTMKGCLNTNHHTSLAVYERFLQKLYASSPSVVEDVLRRLVCSPSRHQEVLPVFLLVCHSISGGCAMSFTLMVHKCLGKSMEKGKLAIPRSVSGDNIMSTVLLYIDTNLASSYKVELYKLLSSALHGDILASLNYGMLLEFINVSISDPQCSHHFYKDAELISKLPVSATATVVSKYIGKLLQESGMKLVASAELKMNDGVPVVNISNLYGICLGLLGSDEPVCNQLLSALSLFCELISRSEGVARASMVKYAHYFMSYLHMLSKGSGKNPKGVCDTASVRQKLSNICDAYYGNQEGNRDYDYETIMSLLVSVMEYMMRLSAETAYSRTDYGETPSTNVCVNDDVTIWCNEWLCCYALSLSSELLASSFKHASAAKQKKKSASQSASKEAGTTSMKSVTLSNQQMTNMLQLSEVVLGYAVKLCRAAILGELVYSVSRCYFKALTIYIPYVHCEAIKGSDKPGPADGIVTDTLPTSLDRGVLMLHAMLSISSDEMASDFIDGLTKVPGEVASQLSLWLKYYMEFCRLARSHERRPGAWLDLYSNIEQGYVEIAMEEPRVKTHDLLSDSLCNGLVMIFETLKGVMDTIAIPLPSVTEPLAPSRTLRVPFTFLLDLDTMMKMFNRCMNTLSHLAREVIRSKSFNNTWLMVDILTNALEFVLDKELAIRRPTVSMLSSVMATYVEEQSKRSGGYLSLCGYQISAGYSRATSSLEDKFKGLDKAMKRLCTTMVKKNTSSTNSMFTSQLFESCSADAILPSALLYAYVFSGTSLQFNVDVLRKILSCLPSDRPVSMFSSSIVGVLSIIEEYTLSKQEELLDLMKFLLCFASMESSLSVAKLNGSEECFSSIMCPEIFNKVALLFTRIPETGESLQSYMGTVRSLISLCAIIGTSALSGGVFWSLKGDERSHFLDAFDKVFTILDVPSRQQCMNFVTSGLGGSKIGIQDIFKTLSVTNERSEHFMEQFIMSVIANASSEQLFDTFTAILGNDELSRSGTRILCLLLQRLVFISDPRSDDSISMLHKGCTSLFDHVIKRSMDGQGTSEMKDTSPMAHLAHFSNFIIVLYRRLYRSLGTMDHRVIQKINSAFCKCLRSLSALYGTYVFEFVRPFLKFLCIVGVRSSSISPSNDSDPVSEGLESSVLAGCSMVYEAIAHAVGADRNADSLSKFVELCTAFIDMDVMTLKDDTKPATEQRTEKLSSRDVDFYALYDYWLSYNLYTLFCIERLPRASAPIARCKGLLKHSRDPIKVISRLIFTVVHYNCDTLAEYLNEVPRLDICDEGARKHHLSSSVLDEQIEEIFSFIKELVPSNRKWFEVIINAASFHNRKSEEYKGYRSLSILMQGVSLVTVGYKGVRDEAPSLKRKKKDVGVQVDSAKGASDTSGNAIVKKYNDLARAIYDVNPKDNYPRLALGALSFFGKSGKASYSGNYWVDICKLQMLKNQLICGYVSSALGVIGNSFKSNCAIKDSDEKSSYSQYIKELSTVIGTLVHVLVDFLISTDAFINGNKLEEATRNTFIAARKKVWRCVIGLSGSLPAMYASPCLSLTSSRLDLMLTIKSPSQALFLDFINSLKSSIRVLYCNKSDLGAFDLELVSRLSSSLAKFTVIMLRRHTENCSLHLCISSMMLLLRSSFGTVTGDELLESILNVILHYTSMDTNEENFALPAGDDILSNRELLGACREIFEEIVSSNSDKLASTIHKGDDKISFTRATNVRVLTLLSFYASVSCKYRHLLKLVLGLDLSQTTLAMRHSCRLLGIIAINLYYNRISSKSLPDLEKIYFLNVNLLSDFEGSTKSPDGSENPPRGKVTNPVDKEPRSNESRALEGSIYIKDKENHVLHLSSKLFSGISWTPNDYNGVKSFEDSIIAFAIQYFSKLKPNDLVELFSRHMSIIQKHTTSIGEQESLPKDGTRLFLRVLSASLAEYGSVGATQFILPRVYHFLSAILTNVVRTLKNKESDPLLHGGSTKEGWKNYVNGILVFYALRVCVETWDSKEASVPDMFLNTILPTIGHALDAFDDLDDSDESREWEKALEDLLLQLLYTCSTEADRIEQVLSGNLVSRSTKCKCHILKILISLWNRASFHLGGTVVNVMPMVGELVEDESIEVQRLAEALNDKIQSCLNSE